MQTTASPLSAAARRNEPPAAPLTRGSRTHGATQYGSSSSETVPTRDSARGESAKIAPATRRDPGPPRSRARASRTMPVSATQSSVAIQSRCTSQAGRPTASPSRKNGPIGKK